MKLVIAIDGPSAAGKSTVAHMLAERLGIHRLDTGALFRALAWQALQQGADIKNNIGVTEAISGCTLDIDIEGSRQKTLVNGEDVSDRIHTQQISEGASDIGKLPEVRELLTTMVRDISQKRSLVVDGRDVGTAMLPDADYKFYLTGEAEERARRRWEELHAKGDSTTPDEVLRSIIARDEADMNRAIAPLKKADDAIEIDSTHLDAAGVVDKILIIMG